MGAGGGAGTEGTGVCLKFFWLASPGNFSQFFPPACRYGDARRHIGHPARLQYFGSFPASDFGIYFAAGGLLSPTAGGAAALPTGSLGGARCVVSTTWSVTRIPTARTSIRPFLMWPRLWLTATL